VTPPQPRHLASEPAARTRPAPPREAGEPLFLGAPDRAGWIRLASSLLGWIAEGAGDDLPDVAGTLNSELPPFRFRVGLNVHSLDGLTETLRATIERLDAGAGALLGESGAFHWPEGSTRWGWLRRGGPAWDWSRWGLRPDWQADAANRDRLSRDLQGVGCATWVLTGMESPRGAWQEGGAVAIEVGSPTEALAALYARGVPIDLGPWYAGRGTRIVDFARPAKPPGADPAARLRDLADALRRARSRHSASVPGPVGAGINDRSQRIAPANGPAHEPLRDPRRPDRPPGRRPGINPRGDEPPRRDRGLPPTGGGLRPCRAGPHRDSPRLRRLPTDHPVRPHRGDHGDREPLQRPRRG
jgi:hypothetical protein